MRDRRHDDDQYGEDAEPTVQSPGSAAPDDLALVGRTIGRYRVRRVIAAGGMGAVYQATQESPRRTIALKVMKQGVASRSALRRFEYESQILARLRHPGIAQVYEAGVHREPDAPRDSPGLPYFAMEYIPNALPITDYARQKRLSTRERLTLFTAVCDAVYHGHQKGIIHRDLKPGNILVDSSGRPRVIDFGVARATDADMAVTTLQTDVGQLIGTLQYMSPEQCDADPHDIDTRSDVYALGVVLYELLGDRLPYDLTTVSMYEAARVIRERDPARLSTVSSALRGDIETITLKALEKDRERRYRSAAELGADITRYLNNEPITARPPSLVYQARTFARRNRALVGGVAATFIVLLAGLAGVSAMYLRAETARAETAVERDRALAAEAEAQLRADELEKVAAFQEAQLAEIDTAAMGVGLRRSIIERRRAALEARADDQDRLAEALAELEAALDDVNFTNVALEALDEHIFERALAAIRDRLADDALIQARLLQTLATTMTTLGLADRAHAPQREALRIRRRVLGDDHPDTLDSISSTGNLLYLQGKFPEAEAYFLEAYETSRRVLDEGDIAALTAIGNMGTLRYVQGDFAGAERYYREALEIFRRTLGDDHPDTLAVISNTGAMLDAQGKHDEAEPYYREALEGRRRVLGDEHPDTLISINSMGVFFHARGEYEQAEPYYREALQRRRHLFGDEHPATVNSISNLGTLLDSLGRYDEAEPYLREALQTSRRVLGNEHPETLHALRNLGGLLRAKGRLEEAEALQSESVRVAKRIYPEGHWLIANSLAAHGRTLAKMQRFQEAERAMLEAYAAFEDAVGPTHVRTIGAAGLLARLYQDRHELDPQAGHDDSARQWRAMIDRVRQEAADDDGRGG